MEFELENITVVDAPGANQAAQVNSTPPPAAEPPANNTPPPVADPNNATPPPATPPVNDTPPAVPPAALPEPQDWNVLAPEIQNKLVGSATNGKITDTLQLNTLLAEYEQLKETSKTPQPPQFKNEKEKKIYDFLSKYPGEDYGQGLQSFVRIESLNVQSLDAKQALKEQFVLKNLEYGIPPHDSEKYFEDDYQEKYNPDDPKTEFKLKVDGENARRDLAQRKADVDTQDAARQTQLSVEQQTQEADFRKQRDLYEQSVQKSMKTDTGDSTTMAFKFGDGVDEKYSFKIPDLNVVSEAMLDYQNKFFQERYLKKDNSGFNTDQMKTDLAVLYNLPQITQQIFDHGLKVGKERELKERVNVLPVNTTPPAGSGQGVIPQNFDEALEGARVIKR